MHTSESIEENHATETVKDGTEVSNVSPCSSKSVLTFKLASTRFLINSFLINTCMLLCRTTSSDTCFYVLILLWTFIRLCQSQVHVTKVWKEKISITKRGNEVCPQIFSL